ncbi:hypothetical protein, variant [Aphanomyces invadans]|uniref:GPI ethanolamine phosphate transferase 2 C-terminal domain-containing protein n=1 Tax=Aphanomyces invadans TaxID=157072 RepID=A0A024TCI3_9STRA|nr:hypothetical protein, variant [Aphanomyces invadans]ETV91758.1 hypothetical protein, variant [Aphanomyces invadans]|eukprot:XP_008879684.1 hypothetical protein, variant [Aphanomyces invadans]
MLEQCEVSSSRVYCNRRLALRLYARSFPNRATAESERRRTVLSQSLAARPCGSSRQTSAQSLAPLRGRCPHHDDATVGFLSSLLEDHNSTLCDRLKGLTTGTLPTFLDIKDNMHSEEIVEDSWIKQLTALNKSIVFMGDDTWGKLYPTSFLRNYSYDSFNVKDLDTVDNGVLEHFFPELVNQTDWDVLIAHFLGVDHVGHTFGPNHPKMQSKLHQMNEFLVELTNTLPSDVLAVVLGDHGMSSDGNHGGATDDETGAALFLFSKARPLHALDQDRSMYDVLFDSPNEVAQVDLVPTLSLLMGLPIPFGNLGAVIPNLFFESTGPGAFNVTDALTHLNDALWVNAHQLRHQFLTTQTIRMDLPAMIQLEKVFAAAQASAMDAHATHRLLQTYLRDALSLSRALYTQFDLVSMIHGIALQLAAFVALHFGSFCLRRLPMALGVGCFVGFTWPFIASHVSALLPGAPLPRYLATAGLSTALLAFRYRPFVSASTHLSRRSVGLAMLVVLHCASLFSNSYLVVQDRVLLFLSATTVALLGMDILVQRKWSHLPPFMLLCVVHRLFAAWPHPNIVFTTVTVQMTWIPMAALGVWICFVHPLSLISYVCVWLYWFDVFPLFLPWVVYGWTILHLRQPSSPLLVLVLLHGPSSPGTFALFIAMATLFHSLDKSPSVPTTVGYCFLVHTLYFQSGHGNSFASLQNAAAFVGMAKFQWHIAGVLLAVNTFGAFWLGLALVPTPATQTTTVVTGYFTLSAICTTIFVAICRRHLMVWAIFAPKFVFDAAISVAVHGLVLAQALLGHVEKSDGDCKMAHLS